MKGKIDNEIIFYTSPEGKKKVEVVFQDENFWLSQKRMAELFGVDVRTVNEHLKNIFLSAELTEEATIRKIRIVQKEGNREVGREVDYYSLDAIIAVGYRVNSYQATQFRIWATKTLKEFIIKGFVLPVEASAKCSSINGNGFFLCRIMTSLSLEGVKGLELRSYCGTNFRIF